MNSSLWLNILSTLILFTTMWFHEAAGHWIDLHAWEENVPPRVPRALEKVTAEGLIGLPREMRDEPAKIANVTSKNSGQEIRNMPTHAGTDVERKNLPSCQDLVGVLSEAQIHMCQLFHDHLAPLVQGASLGLKECRWQFRHHQWNCSGLPVDKTKRSISPRGGSSRVSKSIASFPQITMSPKPSDPLPPPASVDWNSLTQRGSREIAFANAVWSAGVAQSISRWCRDGSLSSCGCGQTERPPDLKDQWRWGGCGDNLQYGYKFSQSFVDSPEEETVIGNNRERARTLANLHNNEAGRRAVLKKTKVACKCHGVSSSCALVTCWHQLPSFREIGDYLKEKYAAATLVKLNKRGRLQVKRAADPVPTVHDLVFVQASPNYCQRDHMTGIAGTSGRVCNASSLAPNSCKNLCCNRGHTTKVIKAVQRCKCKFVWCCQVVCEECAKVQTYDVCK